MAIDGLKILAEIAETEGTALDALIDGRVRRRDLPRGYDNTQAAIVVQLQNGALEAHADVDASRYAIRCYGGSDDPDDAASVMRAVIDLFSLQSAGATSGGTLLSEVESYTQDARDVETGWPVCYVFLRARTV